jgi:microcystin-dependent protein
MGADLTGLDLDLSTTGIISRHIPLTSAIPGVAVPDAGLAGDIPVNIYVDGEERGEKLEFIIPEDYISGNIALQATYRMSTGDTGTVALEADISIADTLNGMVVTSTGPQNIDFNPVNSTNFEYQTVLQVLEGTFSPGDVVVIDLKRLGDQTTGLDTHGGDWEVAAFIYRYTGQVATRATTQAAEFFLATDEPTPPNGTLGAIPTSDYPSGSDAEQKVSFIVPDNWDELTDAEIKLTYAMSTAETATVRVETDINIANVEAGTLDVLGPVTFDVEPEADTGPRRTVTIRSINRTTLSVGSVITAKVARRTGFTDNHGGDFKLINIVMTTGQASGIIEGAGGGGGGDGDSNPVPVGAIIPFGAPAASIPTGWLPCDGSEYGRVVGAANPQPELFQVIGTTWGVGDGATSFNVPDMRARSVSGINDGTLPNGQDGGLTLRSLADTDGSEATPVEGSHSHAVQAHTHNVSGTSAANFPQNAQGFPGIGGTDLSPDNHTHTFNVTSGGASTSSTLSNGSHSHSIISPTVFCPFIIKAEESGGTGGNSGEQRQYALFRDEKPQGTDGGSNTSNTWETRDLNTKIVDTGGNVTLASNQFTLETGVYEIDARAPSNQMNQHRLRLRNISDSVTILEGQNSAVPNALGGTVSHAFLRGRFIITTPKTFEIQHRGTANGGSDAFGRNMNVPGANEVYTEVQLYKVENLGGGGSTTYGHLGTGIFDNVSGTVSGDTDAPTLTGDFQAWDTLTSTTPAGEIHVSYEGRITAEQTEITSIDVPIKGTGDYALKVYVEGAMTANPVYDSGIQSAPTNRTVLTITDLDLPEQPTGEGRYFVVVEAFVDAGENVRVGLPYVRQD